MQQFLNEPERAQKGAYGTSQERAEKQQYSQHVQRQRRGKTAQRRLQRSQRAGRDRPGATVAIQPRHAEFFAVSPVDVSLEKTADVGVVKHRRQHLDDTPPALRAQGAQTRHHPMPMHSMQVKIAF